MHADNNSTHLRLGYGLGDNQEDIEYFVVDVKKISKEEADRLGNSASNMLGEEKNATYSLRDGKRMDTPSADDIVDGIDKALKKGWDL